jgi:hypothetical protein
MLPHLDTVEADRPGRLNGSRSFPVVVAYAALAVVATLAAIARVRIDHARLPDRVRLETLLFFFVGLSCFCIVAPWLMAPSEKPGVRGGRATSALGRATAFVVVAAVMAVLVAATARGGLSGIAAAIARTPVLVLPGIVLIAVAEEVFFRDVLPSAMNRLFQGTTAGRSFSRTVFPAVASQALYAIVHLPTIVVAYGTSILFSTMVLYVLSTKLSFGLMMLAMRSRGRTLPERVVVHSILNVSVTLVPMSPNLGGWWGTAFAGLGFAALLLSERIVPREGPAVLEVASA